MKKKLDILKWLLPLVVLLATACGHDDLVPPDIYVEETVPYVELRIAVPLANPSATRANPMGGEEGNGRERGIENEDKIHDINVYFFNNVDGMNGNGDIDFHLFYNIKNPNDYLNTKVDSVFETNPKFGEKYLTLKFQYWKEGGHISETSGMKFLAIANAGDLGEKATLKELRDYVLSRDTESNITWQTTYDAFSKDASKMDYFLMTTAYNDEYTFGGQSTGDNTIRKTSNGDYTGTTTLQRMYARLDLWYNEANIVADPEKENKIKELKYTVKDATGNTVYLTNVLPVNVMQNPSYLFKKVTNFGNGWSDWSQATLYSKENEEKNALESNQHSTLFKWGGKETPDGDGNPVPGPSDYPTNYVMERHTTEKNSNGGGNLDLWYGNTTVSKVKGTYSDTGDYSNGDNYYSIRNDKKWTFSEYYHGEPQSESSPNYECNHISIISYANENTHPTDCFHSNYLTGMAFRAVYVPEYVFDFDEEKIGTTDESGVKNETGLIPVDETMSLTNICRYTKTKDTQSEVESIYFSSRTDAENYSRKHPEDMAVLTEFTAVKHVVGKNSNGTDVKKWGFVCYYNLWLRHYNDENDTKTDPHPHLPMEYATVRNNIYRVSVSFSGPGDPTPTMREPDTMKARIFVRKWNYRPEPEIIF